jgi:predicted nucleotidyltransferase
VPSGSEYSIVKSAVRTQNYDELCSLLASKTFTDAKIRRMLLFSLFSVTKEMACEKPLYTEVLAVSDLGKKMLKKYADDRRMIVASRVSQIKKNKEAFAQYEFSRLASELVEKCRKISR